jgi:hypothetical protein
VLKRDKEINISTVITAGKVFFDSMHVDRMYTICVSLGRHKREISLLILKAGQS